MAPQVVPKAVSTPPASQHSVKEAATSAEAKVREQEDDTTTADALAEQAPVTEHERMQRTKEQLEQEEQRLTDDLKEKVKEVENQWNSALGDNMKQVKEPHRRVPAADWWVGRIPRRRKGWDGVLNTSATPGAPCLILACLLLLLEHAVLEQRSWLMPFKYF